MWPNTHTLPSSWTGPDGTWAGKLKLPANITILLLPSRSLENIWQYLLQNWLSNRVFPTYDDILDAGCEAWSKLIAQPETIKSIGTRKWAHIV